MNLIPTQDRILVKRIETEQTTAGGIIIPDSAKEKPSQGIIVAVGPGTYNAAGTFIPSQLSTGQKVMFTKWSGTEVKVNDDTLLIMKESDVMAVIDDAISSN